MMCQRLPLQDRMLDVMPELDHERDRPPLPRRSGKTLSQRPNPDEHHDRVTIMQHFRTHEPRKEQTENAAGARPRPTEHINLVSLGEVLSPVREDDECKHVQRAFVPDAVQLFIETRIGGAHPRYLCGC